MRIPEHIVEQIRRETDIVEIISDFVVLKQRGRNYLGLCPFHNEKTPSFNVLPEKGIFKCFGCGKGGDAITFLREHQKLGYIEALRVLAERLNIALPETDSETNHTEANRYEAAYNALKLAAAFYAKNLYAEIGSEALEYVHRRGFNEATLQTFGLGFAPESFTATMNELKVLGLSAEALIDAGLVGKKEETGTLYDRFRGRLMFPIHNQTGRIIGFGGRQIQHNSNEAQRTAKYINSPQSLVYNKSEVLYGIFQAKDALRRLEYGILVEGYADLLSVYQAGFQNVVASSGTSLTKEQLKLLSRFCKRLKIVYDADSAGVRAALRGLDAALEEGFDVEIVRLPSGDDPDSIIQRDGADAFQLRLDRALSLVDFKGEIFRERGLLQTPEGKTEAVHSMMESIAKVPDRIKRDFMIQSVSMRFGLLVEDLYAELTRLLRHERVRTIETNRATAGQQAQLQEPEQTQSTVQPQEQAPTTHSNTFLQEIPFRTETTETNGAATDPKHADTLFPEEMEILYIALNNKGAVNYMKHRLGISDESFVSGLGQRLFMIIDEAASTKPDEKPLESILQIIALGVDDASHNNTAETEPLLTSIIGLAVRKETPSENWRIYNVTIEEDVLRILQDSAHRLQIRRIEQQIRNLQEHLYRVQLSEEQDKEEKEFAILRQIQIADTEKRYIQSLVTGGN